MLARTDGKKRKTFTIYGCPLSELHQVAFSISNIRDIRYFDINIDIGYKVYIFQAYIYYGYKSYSVLYKYYRNQKLCYHSMVSYHDTLSGLA